MYGNFEYGSISYGDAVTSVIIVVSKNEISAIFISELQPNKFASVLRMKTFISARKNSSFYSLKENS